MPKGITDPAKRKIGLSMGALTTNPTPPNSIEIGEALQDDLRAELTEPDYFAGAPFLWVSLHIQYGLKDDTEPKYRRISKKWKSLDVAIEINCRPLVNADRVTVTHGFRLACLKTLSHVAKKYKLNGSRIDELLAIEIETSARHTPVYEERPPSEIDQIASQIPKDISAAEYKKRLIKGIRDKFGPDALPGNRQD